MQSQVPVQGTAEVEETLEEDRAAEEAVDVEDAVEGDMAEAGTNEADRASRSLHPARTEATLHPCSVTSSNWPLRRPTRSSSY